MITILPHVYKRFSKWWKITDLTMYKNEYFEFSESQNYFFYWHKLFTFHKCKIKYHRLLNRIHPSSLPSYFSKHIILKFTGQLNEICLKTIYMTFARNLIELRFSTFYRLKNSFSIRWNILFCSIFSEYLTK